MKSKFTTMYFTTKNAYQYQCINKANHLMIYNNIENEAGRNKGYRIRLINNKYYGISIIKNNLS
jgi:hypothetical protein